MFPWLQKYTITHNNRYISVPEDDPYRVPSNHLCYQLTPIFFHRYQSSSSRLQQRPLQHYPWCTPCSWSLPQHEGDLFKPPIHPHVSCHCCTWKHEADDTIRLRLTSGFPREPEQDEWTNANINSAERLGVYPRRSENGRCGVNVADWDNNKIDSLILNGYKQNKLTSNGLYFLTHVKPDANSEYHWQEMTLKGPDTETNGFL